MKITSLQNKSLKQIVKLRSRSQRNRHGVLLAEGLRAVERALAADWPINEIYICPQLLEAERATELIASCERARIPVIECSTDVFRKMAYRDRPEGVLALAEQIGIPIDQLDPSPNPLLLVAEGLEKPGNLGSLLRIADGAGAAAVIVCDGCTDINNPNVVRSSVGTVFNIPVVETTSDAAIAWLRKRDIRILAATPAAENEYTALDLTEALAVVVGAEQSGLSSGWIEAADLQARIPMLGRGDSLNVSISAGVLVYEALRQRRRNQFHYK